MLGETSVSKPSQARIRYARDREQRSVAKGISANSRRGSPGHGSGTSSAADFAADARREDRKLPRLDDLTLLRLWEQPPEKVVRLYEAC